MTAPKRSWHWRLTQLVAICFGFTIPLAAAAWSPAQDITAGKPQVPFELLRSLHIAVEVKVNDTGPHRLIFDLGAPMNLVSGKFAAEAGLISEESAKRPAFFGMRGEKLAKKIQIGDVVAENVPFMVMDHPTIKAISEILGPIEGIVGYPFFARYRFAIDYPAKTMSFQPTEYKPQNVMTQMMGRMFGDRNAGKKRVAPNGLWGLELDRADGDEATSGVAVARVWQESPAARAGLRAGDRIMTVGGRWTDSPAEAAEAASLVDRSEPVPLEVRRGDMAIQLEITPAIGL